MRIYEFGLSHLYLLCLDLVSGSFCIQVQFILQISRRFLDNSEFDDSAWKHQPRSSGCCLFGCFRSGKQLSRPFVGSGFWRIDTWSLWGIYDGPKLSLILRWHDHHVLCDFILRITALVIFICHHSKLFDRPNKELFTPCSILFTKWLWIIYRNLALRNLLLKVLLVVNGIMNDFLVGKCELTDIT